MRSVTATLVFLLCMCGCTSDNARIDTAVTQCCGAEDNRTFTVKAVNLPAFLGPLMVSNFSVAFANLGMQPVEKDGQLEVELRYEQLNMTPEASRDDFDERISTGNAERFIARIVIEVRDASTGRLVWAGHIQRLHDVGPGEWMHTGIASIAIFDAFTKVLKDYKE